MTDRATTYDELKDAIGDAYPTLSPQLQRLARYALDKPHDLALGTVAAVAEANAVQPSSMIRFANALGFDGFSQMQQVFRSHLVERGAPLPRAHRADAPRAATARRRRAAPVRRRGGRRAAPARGARRSEGAGTPRRGCSPARRRSMCWRSAAPFRSPATSPTRSTSSSCAPTCSTASAACSTSSPAASARARCCWSRAFATTRRRWWRRRSLPGPAASRSSPSPTARSRR